MYFYMRSLKGIAILFLILLHYIELYHYALIRYSKEKCIFFALDVRHSALSITDTYGTRTTD